MKVLNKVYLATLLVGLLIGGSLLGFMVGKASITTTNYYLDTPLPIADYYIGKYSNGSYFAINGSNWDNYVVGTNFTDIIYDCIVALPTLGGYISIGSGTFTGQIYIPDVGTSSTYAGRNIRITGVARFGTRIQGSSIADGEGVIESGQLAWVSGGTWVTLEDLRISVNSNEKYGVHLPFQKVVARNIRLDGTFGSATSEEGFDYAGSGADATPSMLDGIEYRMIGGTRAFDLWDENAVIGSLQINLVTGNLVNGIRLQGTAFSIERLGCYLGNGRTFTGTFLEVGTVEQADIGSIYLTDSATPSSYPTIFNVDSGSSLVISHFYPSTGSGTGWVDTVYADATSRANTMITGSAHAYEVFQVYTSVSNATFKAHSFAFTPSGATATGTVPGDIISVIALNSTHIQFAVIDDDGTTGTSQTVYCHFKP